MHGVERRHLRRLVPARALRRGGPTHEARFDRILLGHGAGGRLTQDLVRGLFLPAFDNPALRGLSDSALRRCAAPRVVRRSPPMASWSIHPSFPVETSDTCRSAAPSTTWPSPAPARSGSPGPSSWKKAAKQSLLRTIAEGARRAAEEAGVQIVAGDTKVVPRGKGDRVYAVTTGLGVSPPERDVGDHRIRPGDAVLVSGPLADHGATVMACRHGLEGRGLRSDCMPLASLAEALLECGAEVHSMHDPTRGGVGTLCSEVADRSGMRITLEESCLPMHSEVKSVCELLGLDPLHLASEGRLVAFVRGGDADKALACLRSHPAGREAVRFGCVEERVAGRAPVALHTTIGGERPVDLLSGANLPRIC